MTFVYLQFLPYWFCLGVVDPILRFNTVTYIVLNKAKKLKNLQLQHRSIPEYEFSLCKLMNNDKTET